MNHIRDRKADLLRIFEMALDQCAKQLDEGAPPPEPPTVDIVLDFKFSNGQHVVCHPAFDLKEPVPNPLPAPRGVIVGVPAS